MMQKYFDSPESRRRTLQIALIVLVAYVALMIPLGSVLQNAGVGIDWHMNMRPSTRAMLSGESPYAVSEFPNAPWTLFFLVPFALLPPYMGQAGVLILGLVVFAYTAYKLGADRIAFTFFMLSPPVVHSLLNANVDWLALLGVVLPPQVGLFLVVIKPQIGIGVIFFWFFEAWRKDGLREVVRIFWPITVFTLVSFLFFGFWPMRFFKELETGWNASLFPYSLPVGAALLIAAVRARRMELALGAGPCLSPYVLLHAWSGALIAIVSFRHETIAAVVGLWLLVLLGFAT